MRSFRQIEEIRDFIQRQPRLIFADDYELAIQSERITRRNYVSGRPMQRQSHDGTWVSLRLIHRKRPGKATTSDTSEAGLRQLVEKAFLSADRSSIDPWFRFPLWKPYEVFGAPAKSGQYTSLAEKLGHLSEQFNETYTTQDLQTLLARKSEKYLLRSFEQMHEADLQLKDPASQEPAARLGWNSIDELSDRAARLEGLARQFERAQALRSRPFKGPGIEKANALVFSPFVVRDWLISLAGWFSAAEVLKGRAPWTDSAGPVLSQALTLVEQGLAAGAFDLEGALVQPVSLLKEGKREGLLHDTYTATRENRISTGNYRRNAGEDVAKIQPWRWKLENSAKNPGWKEARGVAYIDRVEPVEVSEASGGSGGSTVRWDRRLSGYWMDRGEPVGPIESFQVHMSLLEMASTVSEVGATLESFGNISCPEVAWKKPPRGILRRGQWN